MPVPDAPVDPSADRLEAEVARRLAPAPELLRRLEAARGHLLEAVRDAAASQGSSLVRAVVAGSAARATFLVDRLDIDLFLLFPPDLRDERLRDQGLALARAVLQRPVQRYADHPYLRGEFEGFTVDAVPGFAVTDPSRPRSPVDRTPFHQEYLSAREDDRLVGEIRLAKQFLRCLGVYGSEARTEGFSGYLLELLILRFGSLRGWLRAARDWSVPVRLEPPGHEPPRLPPEVALVLADPVDPHRNVASALSRRNLGVVIVSARAYLDRPEAAWFELRPPPAYSVKHARSRVSERGSIVVVLRLGRPDLVDDTLYPQLRKAERSVVEEFERGGFTVLGSASAADPSELVVAIELAYAGRPSVRQRAGPPVGLDRSGDFLASWPPSAKGVLQGPYVRPDGTLAVETREEETDAVPFLRDRLPKLSLGRNLSGEQGGTVEELGPDSSGEGLLEALRGLLEKSLPWPPASRR